MSILFTRFRKHHLGEVQAQPAQVAELKILQEVRLLEAAENGQSFSAWKGADCIACAGFTDIYPTRAAMWSFIGMDAAPYMLQLARFGKWMLRTYPRKRFEAYVQPEFEQGHRFMRLMGFECEHPCLKAYGPYGDDVAMYSQVQQ